MTLESLEYKSPVRQEVIVEHGHRDPDVPGRRAVTVAVA